MDSSIEKRVSICQRICNAFSSSIQNRYLFANVVYAAYASAMLYIDYKLLPAYNQALLNEYGASTSSTTASSTTDDPNGFTLGESDRILAQINNLYIGFGAVHLVNAVMYYWAWLPAGFRFYDRVMVPEYLNMIGAALYLKSACLYYLANDFTSEVTMFIHHCEAAAACIELLAALGWTYTWWLTYQRTPGRGWTFDDPDLWGIVLIVAPSAVYLAYNVQILRDPTQYGENYLYMTGDVLYAAGSYAYLIAALRDDGWLWFLPTAGRLPGWDYRVPMPAREAPPDGPSCGAAILGGCLGFDCGCYSADSEGSGAALAKSQLQPLVGSGGYGGV